MNTRLSFVIISLMLGLLHGCSSTSQSINQSATQASIPDQTDAAPSAEDVEKAEASPEPPSITTTEVPIPDDSLYPLLSAEFALRERRFDDALALLSEQALILDDPALARRALQLAEFRENNELALAMAIRLAELDVDDAAAAATAMGLLIRIGDTERAMNFARAAKERGARINAPALLVNFKQLTPERQALMADAFEALGRDWPDDADIAIALALVRKESGQLAEGLQALEPVLTTNPDEERALALWTQIAVELERQHPFDRITKAVERAPENEDLRLQYARLLAASDHLDEAREQFRELQSLSPRNGDYLFSLALIELEAKAYDNAKGYLEELLALQQRVDEAHYYLGRIAEEQSDTEAALSAYGMVGPSREFLDAVRRAAEITLESDDQSRYRQVFAAARSKNPGQAERLYMLQADLLRERGDVTAAQALYTEALDLLPDSMPLRYARAMSFEQTGDIAQMEKDLREILRNNPSNATTLNALGYTLTVHTDRYLEAADLIELALELSPGDPAILDSLGWVYFKLGRYHQALELLEQAYNDFPDPEVASHLGELLWTMGRTNDAHSVWQDALQRDPDNSMIIETTRRLGVVLPAETHGPTSD